MKIQKDKKADKKYKLKTDGLLKGVFKMMAAAVLNPAGMVSGAADIMGALEIGDSIADQAFKLVVKSLYKTTDTIFQENENILTEEKRDYYKIIKTKQSEIAFLNGVDDFVKEGDWEVEPDFLDKPGEIAAVDAFVKALEKHLEEPLSDKSRRAYIVKQFRSLFIQNFHKTLSADPSAYSKLVAGIL